MSGGRGVGINEHIESNVGAGYHRLNWLPVRSVQILSREYRFESNPGISQ